MTMSLRRHECTTKVLWMTHFEEVCLQASAEDGKWRRGCYVLRKIMHVGLDLHPRIMASVVNLQTMWSFKWLLWCSAKRWHACSHTCAPVNRRTEATSEKDDFSLSRRPRRQILQRSITHLRVSVAHGSWDVGISKLERMIKNMSRSGLPHPVVEQ